MWRTTMIFLIAKLLAGRIDVSGFAQNRPVTETRRWLRLKQRGRGKGEVPKRMIKKVVAEKWREVGGKEVQHQKRIRAQHLK